MTTVIPRDRSPHLLLKSHSSAALFFNGITCKQVNLQVMTLKYHKLIYRLFDLIFLWAWKYATSNYCIIKLILIIVFMIICYISQVFANKPPISFTTLIIKSYCTFITNNIFHDILHSISTVGIIFGSFDLRIFTAINCSIIVKVYERMKFLCFSLKCC